MHGTQPLFLTCSHAMEGKDGRKELLVILCTALLSKRGRLSVVEFSERQQSARVGLAAGGELPGAVLALAGREGAIFSSHGSWPAFHTLGPATNICCT